MLNPKRYVTRVFGLILALFVSSVCLAQGDLQDTLNSHDPVLDQTGAGPSNIQAPGTVPSQTSATPASFNSRMMKILDQLTRILGDLVGIFKDLLELKDGTANRGKSGTGAPGKGKVDPGKGEKPKKEKPGDDAKPEKDSSKPKPPPSSAKGGKALLGWLEASGFTGEKLKTAWAVGMAESGGNPRAFNGNSRTGDKSYGLFQINMIGNLGPARLKQYGLKSNEELFDPMENIKVMKRMSGNGANWSPWSAYKTGAYRKFLSRFPPK